MMEFLRKHKVIVYTITVVGFLGGIIIGFGGYFFGAGRIYETVAMVNGKKIAYKLFNYYLTQALDSQRDKEVEITEDIIKRTKTEVLQNLVQQEVFYQQSKLHGIEVSDQELLSRLQSIPAFQKDGQFSQQQYLQFVILRLKTTPEEFEEEQRREIAGYKLRRFISMNLNVTQKQVDDAFNLAFKAKPEEMYKAINAIEIKDDELKEIYKSQNNGSLQNYEKNKMPFAAFHKQTKYKETFANQYRSKFANQYLNDWFQKAVADIKIKIYLEEIEKLEKQQS